MSIFKRSFFVQAPVFGLLAFAAACGGADQADTGNAEAGGTAAVEAPAPAGSGSPAAPATSGTVHEVRMVTTQNGASGVFEPANLTVKQGDVVRFVMADGQAAHNVSFPVAENSGASNLPPASPYVTAAGQSVDVQVTMDPGTYTYQCDPHAMMGMKGNLTVTQ